MTCVPDTHCNYVRDIHKITVKSGYSLINQSDLHRDHLSNQEFQFSILKNVGNVRGGGGRRLCCRTGAETVVFLMSVCKLNIDFLTAVDFDLTRASRSSKQRLSWDVIKKKEKKKATQRLFYKCGAKDASFLSVPSCVEYNLASQSLPSNWGAPQREYFLARLAQDRH